MDKIVYVMASDFLTPSRIQDIFIQNVNSLELQRVISLPTDDGSPSWSADGEEIVFDSYHSNSGLFSLHRVKVNGTGLRTLVHGGVSSHAVFRSAIW